MNWRESVARAVVAENDRILDAISAALSVEFDLPAGEVRAELDRLTQPAIDQIIAELTAGEPIT